MTRVGAPYLGADGYMPLDVHSLDITTTPPRMSQAAQKTPVNVPDRQIRASQPTPESIVVYQAYSVDIAEAAVAQQRLNASEEFKMARMSWLKPSFYCCMYRAGWSYKGPPYSRILRITMSKEGFLTLLGEASPSSGPEAAGKGEALVRYRWESERTIRLERLPYRSLQLGVSAGMKERWVNEWILKIEDITEDVRRWKAYVDEDGKGVRKARREVERRWNEAVFEVGAGLEMKLGMPEESDNSGIET